MKIINRFITIVVMIFNTNMLFGQIQDIKSILIEYVDFSILTDSHVDCNDFQEAFDYKSIEIKDTIITRAIATLVSHFKEDTINNYLPDTRAKIIIKRNCKNDDVICISNFGIGLNNIAVLHCVEFIEYIKALIKERDDEFHF